MSWPVCQECKDAAVRCIDSRWKGVYVRRRYQCSKGHRFSTIEISANMMRGYQMASATFKGEDFSIVPNSLLKEMTEDFRARLEGFQKRLEGKR